MTKYSLNNILKHIDTTLASSRAIFDAATPQWENAFECFSDFFDRLSSEPKSIERNVKLLLSTRFINHIISGFLLTERGLISDSIICERAALETLAGFKLIVASPELAEKYNNERFPSPAEVRRKLLELGYANEVENIKELYKNASGLIHISRDHESFSVNWNNSNEGVLYIAGNFNQGDINHMLEYFPALIHWFIMPLKKEG